MPDNKTSREFDLLKDKNISSGAAFVIRTMFKLLDSPAEKEELLNGLSDDMLGIYINSLRKLGFKIKSPNKSCREYSLREQIDLLKITVEDVKFLIGIKEIIANFREYKSIYHFNNLAKKIADISSPQTKNLLYTKVINTEPFGLELHQKIEMIEEFLKSKFVLEVNYLSPNSGHKKFLVEAISIKLENDKLYFWCYNIESEQIQYLRTDRILDIKQSDINCGKEYKLQSAVCEFYKKQAILFTGVKGKKITEETPQKIVAQIDYENEFHFLQYLSSLGDDVKIIAPENLVNTYANILKETGAFYGE
ncbi:MAG: WYL domain-containing protein [Candidatus Gastranaerophilales bacterium]|nr:WYL domain-containing protein [Candidatus Gastranaerophilales bacterium]